jgi:Fe-S cluster assembly scaffold protein SufB
MIIEKNWFYDLSSVEEIEIIVANWIVASFFDDWKIGRKIYLKESSRLNFYSVLEWNWSFEFFQEEENSNLEVKVLLFVWIDLTSRIYSQVNANSCKNYVKICSVVLDTWKLNLDWVIKIEKWLKDLNSQLIEENTFLWNNWKIEASPKLLVESNDVKASHSCKIERINKDKMFYLASRWLDNKTAFELLLKAKFESLFSDLKVENNNFYENLIKNLNLTPCIG